jgi:hypothetical protein
MYGNFRCRTVARSGVMLRVPAVGDLFGTGGGHLWSVRDQDQHAGPACKRGCALSASNFATKTIQTTLRSLLILLLVVIGVAMAPRVSATLVPIHQIQSSDFAAPPALAEARFGGGVAMGSDWLAAGAPQDGQLGNDAGAVYMYRRSGDNWLPHSKLTHQHGEAGQRFGEVLGLDGDRLVVGMPTASSFPSAIAGAGQAVVYRYDGSAWIQVATLQSPNAVENGNYGSGVDVSGDVLAVGAPGELTSRGRVYVYRDMVTFTTSNVIEIAGTVAGDRTGASVAVDDSGVGVPNNEVLAIGAPALANGVGVGFALYGTNFTTRVPLIDPQSASNGRFSSSIDVHQNRVIVSRPGQGPGQGKVYVFSGSFYSVVHTLPLPAGLPATPVLPVALHGNTVVVGARDADAARGRTFGFRFSGGNWTLVDDLQPANTVAGDQYGTAVATYLDRAVIGAPQHDPAALTNAGTAYTYIPAPEFQVTPTLLNLSESGPLSGTLRFTLDRAPTANVTSTLTFDSAALQVDSGAGFGNSPQTLTLTPANALAGVTIAVRTDNDAIDEVDPHFFTITTSASSSSDTLFHNLVVPDPAVGIADNDQAIVRIQRTGGLNSVSEGGFTDGYTVVLASQPVAPVTATVSFPGSDITLNGDSDGTYQISFDSTNWFFPHPILLAAVNDRALEGAPGLDLIHSFNSADPLYNGITAVLDGSETTNRVPVTVHDNESATIGWVGVAQSTTEGGTAAPQVQFLIQANPTSGPTPTLEDSEILFAVQFAPGTASAADVGAISGTLSFADGSAHGAVRTVNLPHIDDALADGTENYTLTLQQTQGQPVTVTPVLHTGTILDNDVASVLLAQSGGTAVIEGEIGDSFSVVLTSEPFAPVAVQVSGDAQATALPATLNFDAGNWSQPQQVAVAAIDEAIAEGPHTATVVLAVSSIDAAYQGFAVGPVNVVITDDDHAGTAVVHSGGETAVTEGGAADSITVALTSQPTAPVLITVQPDAQLGATPTLLNFDAGNWQVPQSVIVSAVNDLMIEADHSGTLTFTSSSMDTFYQGLALAPLTVAIVDNDSIPEITLVPPLSRQQGSPGGVSPIATVTDEHQTGGTLSVSVVPGGSAVGISVTDLVNSDGAVSARLVASCTATAGTLRLEVVDVTGFSATADLQVDVIANTPPQLSYAAASVVLAEPLTAQPASGPADNGSVDTVAVHATGTFSGSVSVNPAGQVQLSAAGPVGTHAIIIRATDNCGAVHDATLNVDVTRAPTFKQLTADIALSRFGQPVTFTAELVGLNPTGNVQFFADTTLLGSAALEPGTGGGNVKLATLTTSQLPAGLNQVRVEYAGDINNLPSTSANLPHTVLAAGTRIVVTPAANPAPLGSVAMQVQVSAEAPGGGVPAGTVLLVSDRHDNQCTVMLQDGQGSCALSFGSAGYNSIVATYAPAGGDHLASEGSGAVVVVADTSSTDLRVRIGNGVSIVQPGQLLSYMIVADNPGSSAAVGRLQVPLAPIFTNASWHCLSAIGSTCPVGAGQGSGTGGIDVDLNLDVGAVVIYELQVTALPLPEAPVEQSAQLNPRTPTIDPRLSNNLATDTDPMGLFGDGYEDANVDE